MAKYIDEGLLPPDHPIYSEEPQSYSPHSARASLRSMIATQKPTAGPQTPPEGSGKTTLRSNNSGDR